MLRFTHQRAGAMLVEVQGQHEQMGLADAAGVEGAEYSDRIRRTQSAMAEAGLILYE